MPSKTDTIRFNWNRISTDEYALLNEQPDTSSEFQIEVHLSFAYFEVEKIIASRFKCVFNQNNKPCLVMAVSSYFNIHAADWDHIFDKKEGLFLPQKSALHLASLTVGTARGVLHAKTDGGIYNKIIVPPINMNDIIKSDVQLKPRDDDQVGKGSSRRKS